MIKQKSRTTPLVVHLSDEDRELIRQQATRENRTMSNFAATVLLGHIHKSQADSAVIGVDSHAA